MGTEDRDAGGSARGHGAAAEHEGQAVDRLSSDAALALASVSLRFHNSTANSSPPSRPTTSEARTWPAASHDRLQHLVARGMPESVVDRLQAIDVEHDQRAAGVISLDEGDRAVQFALKTAPVQDIQQEVGIGGGLQLLDSRLRLGQLRLQPADRRFGVAWPPRPRRGRGLGPARRGFWPRTVVLRRFAAPAAAALVFFFMPILVAGLSYEGLPGFTKTG